MVDIEIETEPSEDGECKIRYKKSSKLPENAGDPAQKPTQELEKYSRSILHALVHGNNNANENRFLREVYWRIIEVLVNLRHHE